MALKRHPDGLVISDLDPGKGRDAVDAELFATPVTASCIRDNRKSLADKEVVVHMWTDAPGTASFADHDLGAGDYRDTNLSTLGIRVVAFEIRWRIPDSGSPMFATTGRVDAPPGRFFRVFGIRWDRNDLYRLIRRV